MRVLSEHCKTKCSEAVGSQLHRHTLINGYTHTHTHPKERFLLDYTSVMLNFMFAKGLCYVEPDWAPLWGAG